MNLGRIPQAPPPRQDGFPADAAELPRLRLATLLLGLVLAVLLPALGLGAAVAWKAIEGHRAAAEGRLQDTAQALALALDREIAGVVGALSAFATSPAFGPDPAAAPDLPALDAQARRVAQRLGSPVVLARRDGTQLLTTRLPPGAPLPAINATALAERVFGTGRPAVADLLVGSVSGRRIFAVAVPVPDATGRVALVASTALDVERLHDLFRAQSMPEDGFAAVSDARNILVARSDALHERLVGTPIPPENVRRFAERASGLYRAVALDGVERVIAFRTVSSAPGWTMFVAQSAAAFDEAWRRPLLTLTAGGALAVMLGAVLALLTVRQILVPLHRLEGHARAAAAAAGEPGRGDAAEALPPVPVAELEALRRGFAAAEAALRYRAEVERAAAAALTASEARLSESEARLRDLVATLDLGASLVRDLDGTIRFWSRGCVQLHGWTVEEAIGRSAHDLLGTVFPVPLAEIQAVLERDGRWAGDLRHRTRDGRTVVVAARMALRRDPAGRPGTVLESLIDVTAQRQAEAALAGSEARLRSIVETAADGIIVATADGRIVSANPAALRIFGYGGDGAALVGQGLEVLMPAEEAALHGGYLAAHRATGQARAIGAPGRTLLGRRRDGGEFPIELSVGSFDVGGERYFTDVVRDVSQRAAAEARLAESEARWRTLAQALPHLVWTCRPDGACDWVNRRWEHYTGLPAERHLGLGWLDAVHPEDRDRAAAAWTEAVQGRRAFDMELRLRGADGTYRWFKDHAVPLRGPEGEVEGEAEGEVQQWFGTLTDITDAVAAREVKAREAAELDRLATERGRALAESEARLARAAKMEALGRLAGGIAHDFNNVLQAMQGGIALATRRLAAEPEAARRYLGLAAEAGGRGAAVTGRLLSFARRGELRAEAVAPAAMLAGLAEMLRHTLGAKIQLLVETVPGLPPLLADRGQLEAVLVNLANNARDAMPAGGKLTLAAETAPVPESAGAPQGLAPGRYVRLSVTDEGEGMPPEVLARVTEPFFTTKPMGRGTGLGLAMARGFVEQSGGGLAIESGPGRGTTVALWLPLVPETGGALADSPALGRAAGTPPGGGGGGQGQPMGATVLLAEDKPEVRAVLKAQLTDHGHSVVEAEEAATALALLEGGLRPDALVTDLTMPGTLDGLDLLREARSRLPGLPAVLVTGRAGEAGPGRLEEAERDGPFALLRKPVAPEDLLAQLGRVLHAARRTAAGTGA